MISWILQYSHCSIQLIIKIISEKLFYSLIYNIMDFKKEMWLLLKLNWTGSGKLITINQNGKEQELFTCGTLAINTCIFSNKLFKIVLKTISNEYRNKEIKNIESNEIIYSDDFFDDLINKALLLWDFYSEEGFDRYENWLVSPWDKSIWMRISDMDLMSKIYSNIEDSIDYYYKDKYIIWVWHRTNQILFITTGIEMSRQLTLLWEQDTSLLDIK